MLSIEQIHLIIEKHLIIENVLSAVFCSFVKVRSEPHVLLHGANVIGRKTSCRSHSLTRLFYFNCNQQLADSGLRSDLLPVLSRPPIPCKTREQEGRIISSRVGLSRLHIEDLGHELLARRISVDDPSGYSGQRNCNPLLLLKRYQLIDHGADRRARFLRRGDPRGCAAAVDRWKVCIPPMRNRVLDGSALT